MKYIFVLIASANIEFHVNLVDKGVHTDFQVYGLVFRINVGIRLGSHNIVCSSVQILILFMDWHPHHKYILYS